MTKTETCRQEANKMKGKREEENARLTSEKLTTADEYQSNELRERKQTEEDWKDTQEIQHNVNQ